MRMRRNPNAPRCFHDICRSPSSTSAEASSHNGGHRTAGGCPTLSCMDPGVVFNVDGIAYGLSVEEAWKLKEHLPLDVPGLAGVAKVVSVQLEELVYQADGLNPPSPPINVFHSEKPALR